MADHPDVINGGGTRDPWDIQPKEGVRAFQAFALYRDMLEGRSIRKVAHELRKDVSVIAEWSSRWRWVERAEEYDLYLDRRLRELRETAAENALERHGRLGRGLQTLSMIRLAGGQLEDGTRVPRLDPTEMDGMAVVRAAEVGVKLERLALGLPTDFLRSLHMISTMDFEKILSDVVDQALRLIPDAKHEEFVSRVRSIGLGAARE